jgi:hypothetical protein
LTASLPQGFQILVTVESALSNNIAGTPKVFSRKIIFHQLVAQKLIHLILLLLDPHHLLPIGIIPEDP